MSDSENSDAPSSSKIKKLPPSPPKKESGAKRRKRLAAEQKKLATAPKIVDFFAKTYLPPTDPTDNDDHTRYHQHGETGDANLVEDTAPVDNVPMDITHDEHKDETRDDYTTDGAVDIQHCADDPDEFNDILVLRKNNTDIGLLEFNDQHLPVIAHNVHNELVQRGSHMFQNKDAAFPAKDGRAMTKGWFCRTLANGQTVNRSWLVFSPVKGSAFCFCCLLFSKAPVNQLSSFEMDPGFRQWKNVQKLGIHENGLNHRRAFRDWKEAERRLNKGNTIDAALEAQIDSEREKWRAILTRLLDCVKFLAVQNLALRGHVEILDDDATNNPGNFLALLSLISRYDPLMQQHLQYAKNNPRSVNYLSSKIQNEFIAQMATAVRKQLIAKVVAAKYYGIMFDSTPDLGHREQMSQVIRYVDIDYNSKTASIKESFVGFIQIHEKTAESIEMSIVDQLESDGIDLQDCRSQCYDNAAVMAGHLSGVQQRILARSPHATFVNCDNHSLNLCAFHAASQDAIVMTFFGTVEAIYLFFSRSTLRWDRLKETLALTVKKDSTTRWSARAVEVKAINDGLEKLVDLLEDMAQDQKATSETRGEAVQLQHSMLTFNFLTLLPFWNSILSVVDRVQKRLQDPTMNFQEAYRDIMGLQQHLHISRDEIISEALKESEQRCVDWDVAIETRRRRKKRMPGELAVDAGLTAKAEVSRVMTSVFDRLDSEMSDIFSRLKTLDTNFGFLLNMNKLFAENQDDLRNNCNVISEAYSTDTNADDLFAEITDCKMLLAARAGLVVDTPIKLLNFIIAYGDDVFPNLRVALQILLTIAVSIASCERSFSKLKLILSYLRVSMGQQRLNDLALMSIENETLETVSFDDVIDNFARNKARKVNL